MPDVRNIEELDLSQHEDTQSLKELQEYASTNFSEYDEPYKRAKIQLEQGPKAITGILELTKSGQLKPYQAEMLLDAIDGDSKTMYEAHKTIAHLPGTISSTTGRAMLMALEEMCEFAPDLDTFKKDISEIQNLIDANPKFMWADDARKNIKYMIGNFEYHKEFRQKSASAARNEAAEAYSSKGKPPELWEYKITRPNVEFVENSALAGGDEWLFDSNGLSVSVSRSVANQSFEIDGQELVIRKGKINAQIDFTPNTKSYFVPNASLRALALGYKGLGDLMKRIYHPEQFRENLRMPYPEIIEGSTNRKMADIATRFGFKIIDADMDKNIDEDGEVSNVTVVARTADVKKAFDEIQKSGLGGKIIRRAINQSLVSV